jgi:hypothetical protein
MIKFLGGLIIMGRKHVQKVFLENLPQKGMNLIDWKNSIGYTIKGVYNDISFEFKIKNYQLKGQILTIIYDNKEFNITTCNLIKTKVGKILGKRTSDFKIEIGTNFKDSNRDITITDREYRKEERIDKLGRKSVANIKWYKYTCNVCGFNCGEHYSAIDRKYKEEL